MGKSSKGKLLLSTVSNSEYQKILNLSAQNKSKKHEFTFLEAIRSLSNNELETLFHKLFSIVESHAAAALEIDDTDQPCSSKDVKSSDEAAQIIQVAVDLGSLTFSDTLSVPTGLLQLAVMLHGVLLGFSDKRDNLKNSIAHLCEKLYHGKIEEREDLAPNTVIYILDRTLRVKGTKTDVKRIWALKKEVLDLANSEEVDKEELWFMLKKCVASNLYLSLPEGQKFISLVLTLDIAHCSELHDRIKQHLPSCSLKQSEAYGKIYFDAWSSAVRSGSHDLRKELEFQCIQDLMYHAVHVRRNIPKSLVPILRKLLAYFHSQKKEVYVLKMLRQLYEPIMWRSLKVADGDTRANAAQLFFDVFPLEDPDYNVVETEIELNKQTVIIKELLLDEYPVVRCAATIGVCVVMSTNWEIFPAEMMKSYLRILIDELSCDSSSVEVRSAVVKGMRILLENHLTHPTLKAILPKMQGLFHDVSEKVRCAFCQLLLQIKKICTIRYYEVVPIEHLLARLEEDSSAVAKLIVDLIHNSYFPKNDQPELWLARCVELIKADRGASRVFFQHVSSFITIEVAVKFMLQACKAVHLYAVSKSSEGSHSKRNASDNKENVSTISNQSLTCLEETMGFQDPDIVAGLLDGVVILWVASQSSLEKPENKELYKLIVGKFSKYLRLLLIFFKNTSIWESVYYLSSFLPPTSIPNLSSSCLSRLKNLPPDTPPHEIVTLLECLCNQNRSSEVLEVIKEWVQTDTEQEQPVAKKRKVKGKGRKQVTIQDPSPSNPFLGLKFLHSILDQPVCRNAVLKRNPDKLKELLNMIDIIKRKVEKSLKVAVTDKESNFLSGLFYALLKIAVLLQGEKMFNAVDYIEDILMWATKNITKHISNGRASGSSGRGRSSARNIFSESWKVLALSICKYILKVIIDVTVIGFVNDSSSSYLKFTFDLLKLDDGFKFILPMSRLLLNSLILGNYLCVKQKSTSPFQKFVLEYFCETISCLKDKEFIAKIPPAELKESQNTFSKILQLAHTHQQLPKELVDEMVTFLIEGIINDTQTNTEDQETEVFEKISIPCCSSFFLSIITSKSELITKFLKTFCKWLTIHSVKDIQRWIACYVILLHLIQIKNVQEKSTKEIENTIESLEKTLNELFPESEPNLESEEESEERCSAIPDHYTSEMNKIKDLLTKSGTA